MPRTNRRCFARPLGIPSAILLIGTPDNGEQGFPAAALPDRTDQGRHVFMGFDSMTAVAEDLAYTLMCFAMELTKEAWADTLWTLPLAMRIRRQKSEDFRGVGSQAKEFAILQVRIGAQETNKF